jgi:dsDNA-binding SOS-regulon protein
MNVTVYTNQETALTIKDLAYDVDALRLFLRGSIGDTPQEVASHGSASQGDDVQLTFTAPDEADTYDIAIKVDIGSTTKTLIQENNILTVNQSFGS